ncbi:Tripartite-type tricarboxylate transporter, receptor component TctC [Variovorax sp. CF079]|uniref:Bug family tripartite tricarboxylate transporter substrate binding protein n=1 Tax=Variovorax sp. CF079 TaxID=1882774 RepID=UPI000892523C|nr:tripartite tricarboxylate transporter substrate binding protein [Variovorax sp. CF079]SDE79873.1 Tripartite-type tricarboxylate transporter, receptor component TctC [Variovorax sp. CF079]
MNIARRGLLLAAACLGLAASLALAQTYPNRPIKLILPFPAGSATDGTARVIAEDLRKGLGQPIVIENQAGADGNIAAMNAKRAAPDGYTLFMSTNSAHAVNKTLYANLAFDPEKDFEPVAGLISIPLTLLVRKDLPASDVESFIAVAKAHSGSKPLSFGSGNTSSQIAAALLQSVAGVDITHVPYRGTPQALTDLVGGQIDALLVDPYSSMGFVQNGQLKVLAVTGKVRHPLLPDVPTMGEAGYKDVQVVTWAALFAPAGTNPAIVDRLNAEVAKSLSRPETKAAIQKMAMDPMPMTPSQLRSFVRAEIQRWGRLVELAGMPKK